MILLDTNVLSEMHNPNGNVLVTARLGEHEAEVHLSVVTLGEMSYGIQLLRAGRRRAVLEQYYVEMRRTFRDRILPVVGAVAELWAELRARYRGSGRVLPMADGLIAATALVHDLTLWTRNVRDFDGTGVRLFNPWED